MTEHGLEDDRERGAELGRKLGARLIESLLYCTLTGFMRREYFEARLRQPKLVEHRRAVLRPVVVYFDLNFFKGVNDVLGHDVGNQILKAFGFIARFFFRRGEDLVRLGGDEFAVVADTEEEEWVKNQVEVIRNLFTYVLGQRYFYEKSILEEVQVTNQDRIAEVLTRVGFSFGVAHSAGWNEPEIKAALFVAEQAMYRQKREGR